MTDNEKRLEDLESNQKEIFARLNSIELTNGVVNEKLDNIKENLRELKNAINALSEKPGKRWDSLVFAAIAATVAAMVSFLAAKL